MEVWWIVCLFLVQFQFASCQIVAPRMVVYQNVNRNFYPIASGKAIPGPKARSTGANTVGYVPAADRTYNAIPSDYQCAIHRRDAGIQHRCGQGRAKFRTLVPSNNSLFVVAGVKSDQDIKYFHESKSDGHLDERFGTITGHSTLEQRNNGLRKLFFSWHQFAGEKGLTYWISHGMLIGYYWSRDLLPWDQDLDVQVTYSDLVAKYLPLSKSVYQGRYLFEVNPHHVYRSHQRDNVIDARFVDTLTGLYVDVTALSYMKEGNMFQCKSPHSYRYDDLFPLHESSFCGVSVWVNNHVSKILSDEYGMKCLHDTKFQFAHGGQTHRYTYDTIKGKWSKVP